LIQNKTDLQRANLKGNVKKMLDENGRYLLYDEKGFVTEETGTFVKSAVKHNSKGQLIESENFRDGKLFDKFLYKYDVNSNCTQCCVYQYSGEFNGDLVVCFYYAYDKKGLKISEKRGLPGDIGRTITFKNDSLGNPIMVEQFNNKSKKLENHTIYSYAEYDSHGNWTKRTSVDTCYKSGTYKQTRIIEYY
jgi:hypothetical protein